MTNHNKYESRTNIMNQGIYKTLVGLGLFALTLNSCKSTPAELESKVDEVETTTKTRTPEMIDILNTTYVTRDESGKFIFERDNYISTPEEIEAKLAERRKITEHLKALNKSFDQLEKIASEEKITEDGLPRKTDNTQYNNLGLLIAGGILLGGLVTAYIISPKRKKQKNLTGGQ